MEHVRFISRVQAAGYEPEPGAVLISIHDRDEERLRPLPGWAEVLFLVCADTQASFDCLVPFSRAKAAELLDFVERHEAAPEVVVHCRQGQQRSAGVALFLAQLYGVPCLQDSRPVTRATWPQHNKDVFELLQLADLARR